MYEQVYWLKLNALRRTRRLLLSRQRRSLALSRSAPGCTPVLLHRKSRAAPSEQASQARSHQARARELPPQRAHVLGVQLRNVRLGAVHLLQHARVD